MIKLLLGLFFLLSSWTVTAQTDLTSPIDRKLFVLLLNYHSQKGNGLLAEQKARQKFFDQFEDLWASAGIESTIPYSRLETLLAQNSLEEASFSTDHLPYTGRIRIKRQTEGRSSCIEYQDGLWVRELPQNFCP